MSRIPLPIRPPDRSRRAPTKAMPKLVCILIALMLVPLAASAQVGIAFEFSFSNPGARSMGFGGAFVALADDATAAFANPAGLVQLVQPEVSMEVRHWSYSIPYTFTGRLTGSPTNIGLDTKSGVYHRTYEDERTGVSFLSFVLPRKRWSLAFYRHLSADFQLSSSTQGLFAEGEGPLDTERLFDRIDRTELETVAYGLSGAFEVHERLSLGLTLTYYDGLLTGFQNHYKWDDESFEGFFGPTTFLPERFVAGTDFKAGGSDLAFNAGLLWRLAENWRFGAFYRRAPTFDFDITLVAGPESQRPDFPPGESFRTTTPIDYPNVYGAGLSFRSGGGGLTLSYEWDHVEYSRIFDSLGETSSGELIEDGDEHHLGAEYAFLKARPVIALRTGMWLDPNHQVRSSFDDPILLGLLGTGGDEMHFSFGIGAAFKSFQIDLGVDLADRRDSISLSGIYSW